MRKNDFFKYMLFGRSSGGSTSQSELEAETFPYTFTSDSYRLKNYRIYGNTVDGESVGDLVTEGDHVGEYCVPVKIEGKNLWSSEVVQGSISVSGNYDSSNSNRVCSRRIYLSPGTYKLTSNLIVRIIYAYYNNSKVGAVINNSAGIYNPSFTVPENANNVSIGLMKKVDGNEVDITPEDFEWGQIEKGSVATDYEPYHEPITTNIYLHEQIKIVDDNAEYIDFKEQKQYFADGTATNIPLPLIPTIKGTNILSISTTVQPSKLYLQGKISEIETVSAQTLQANMRSLQSIDLSENPQTFELENGDFQPDVMPIEKPVLNLNDVSEIENAEIERGVENAE